MILWLAIAGLAAAAIALVLWGDAGTLFGLEAGAFAQIAALAALGAVIGAAVLADSRKNLPRFLKSAAIWLVLGVVLVTGYAFRHEIEGAGLRVAAELVPGMAIDTGDGRVAVARASSGHFVLDTAVNGAPVHMLLDTGASTVVLTLEDAERAGMDTGSLAFTAPVWTASGRTEAAPVVLDRVAIGSIEVERVRAMVARPGTLRESLLGMSFLDRIPSWRVERNRLILGG